MPGIRQNIISLLEKRIKEKHKLINDDIDSLQDASAGEQKSSAGDKHETSREMMRQELDLLQLNLSEIHKDLQEIEFLKLRTPTLSVAHGSLVNTDKGYFFLTYVSGIINYNDHKIICVSPASPFAKAIMSLKTDSDFSFQNLSGKILAVI